MKKVKEKINFEKFYRCVCGSEALLVDSTDFKEDGEVCLAMFDAYNYTKLSIKERLRYGWRTLTKGIPFTDQIILNKSQIEDIRDHFTKLLDEK